MAYVTPSTRATGAFVTAAIWNQDVVDNVIAVHTGAVELSNQQAGNFVLASHTNQLSAEQDEQVLFFMEIFS